MFVRVKGKELSEITVRASAPCNASWRPWDEWTV